MADHRDPPRRRPQRARETIVSPLPADLAAAVVALHSLSNGSRLRILQLLMQREACVSDLVRDLALPQPVVSIHLRGLRQHRLVRTRRKAKWVFYSLDAQAWARFTAPIRTVLAAMAPALDGPVEPLHAEDTAAAEGLTVMEAARWAGVSRHTIKNWIARGLLPSTRVGRQQRIRLADLATTLALVHVGSVVPAWRRDRTRTGRRLRILREAAGLNQFELAAASGLTHEALSMLETGKRAPTAEMVRHLAQALGVEPEQFVSCKPLGLTMLSVTEAAARLDVPRRRVQEWLHDGLIAGVKVSNHWRVLAVVVEELERSGRLRGRSRRLDLRYRG